MKNPTELARRVFKLAAQRDAIDKEIALLKEYLLGTPHVTEYNVRPTRVRAHERAGYTARRMRR